MPDDTLEPTSARATNAGFKQNIALSRLSLSQQAELDRKSAYLEKLTATHQVYQDKISSQHAGAAGIESLMGIKDPSKFQEQSSQILKDNPDAMTSPAFMKVWENKQKEADMFHAGEAKRAAASFNDDEIADVYNKANAAHGPDFAEAAAKAAADQKQQALKLFSDADTSPENRAKLGDITSGTLNWQDPKLLQQVEMQTAASKSSQTTGIDRLEKLSKALTEASKVTGVQLPNDLKSSITNLMQQAAGTAPAGSAPSPEDALAKLLGRTPGATPTPTPAPAPTPAQTPTAAAAPAAPLPGGDELGNKLAANPPEQDVPPGLEGSYHESTLLNSPPPPTPTPIPVPARMV
jgi:hypothetical protein